jgi:hypothetical protein
MSQRISRALFLLVAVVLSLAAHESRSCDYLNLGRQMERVLPGDEASLAFAMTNLQYNGGATGCDSRDYASVRTAIEATYVRNLGRLPLRSDIDYWFNVFVYRRGTNYAALKANICYDFKRYFGGTLPNGHCR